MNAEVLLKHCDRISETPDAVPRLRQFILDLAVRGKLVEQDPNDEPATQIIKRIEAEKVRLLETPALKTRTIPTDEVPFSIPNTWSWIRLGDAFQYDCGIKRDPKHLNPDRWLLELEDVEKDTSVVLTRLTVAERESRSTKSEFRMGDILYGKLRPYLNKVVVATEPGYSTTEIVAIRPYIPFCPRYCAIALRRSDFVEYVNRLGRGTKMPRLRTPDAVVALFPLAPCAEQYRIAAKVDELMVLCDRLEEAQEEREARRDRLTAASLHQLNSGADGGERRESARFFINHLPQMTARPDQVKGLRQSILNLVVRGKLVSQCSEDEAASKLLDRIRSNNNSAGASGSTRQRVPDLPPVDVLLAPFDIPSNWTWARFPELGIFGRGKSKHRPRNDRSLFEGGTHPLIQTGDVARSKGVIETYTGMYNDVGLAQSQKWPAGTLCITIAANIADSGILSFDACFPDSVVGFLPAPAFPNARYFEYFLRTAKGNLLAFAPATAQKNINLEILNAVLVPLPPLAEQIRIVERVDQLMRTCDQLEGHLTAIRTEGRNLLEAVLHYSLAPALIEAQ